MSQVTASVDQANAAVSVVLLWQESFAVTGTVADGASTKYAVGDQFPAATGSTGYRLDLPDGFHRLVATLTGAAANPGGTDIDLYLTRNRKVVAASTASGDDEQIVIGRMPGTTYELWAYGHTVVPTTVGYALTVTGAVPVNVDRVYPDGTTTEVLGSPVVPGYDDGYAALWDTVAPLDIPVYYRATDPLTNVSLTSNTVTVTGQGDGWLKDPADPTNDIHLADCVTDCPAPTPNLGGGLTQIMLDTFTRTVTGGWGTADTGQTYTTSGGSASDYSVSSGQGRHSLGSVNSVRRTIESGSRTDSTDTFHVTIPVVATGQSIYTGRIIRWTDANNHYLARLEFTTTSATYVRISKFVAGVETSLGLVQIGTYIAGTRYAVQVHAAGSVLRIRAWQDGQAPPTIWHLAVTDATFSSGQAGFASILFASNTNSLPVVITYDNLSVTTLTTPFTTGPAVDRSATFQALDADTRASASGVFPIIDAARARSVAQTRKAPESTLQLVTHRLAQMQAVVNILASGRALLLQLDARYGFAYDTWASDFIDVGDATEARIAVNNMTRPQRMWRLKFSHGRAPAIRTGQVGGNGLGPAGTTYQDEIDSGSTYQDEITAGGTYLQAAIGQVS